MSKPGGSLSVEQAKRIDGALAEFISEGAKTALLVDRDGHLITQSGDSGSIDGESFGALISANFASTQQIATQIGEKEFNTFYIQGATRYVYVEAVGDAAVMVSVFENSTKLGMAKVFASKTSKSLADILAEGGEDEGMNVGGGFADSALAELDTILGG